MSDSRSLRIAAQSLLAIALLLIGAAVARADVSEAVQKKLRGKVFLAAQPLSLDGASDAEVIKSLERQARAPIGHTESEGVASWSFSFVAFLKTKPGVTELSVDFYAGKDYVANKRLAGVAKDLQLLVSDFQLSEDDGLTRGKPYDVKLTARVKGKDVVLATARVKLQ